jgi:hypothetical protein
VLYILKPLNPINLIKKEICLVDPARAGKQEYRFHLCSLPPPPWLPTPLFLFSSTPNWGYTPLFSLIRSPLTPTHSASLHSHLVFVPLFFLLACGSNNLATLSQLNKPRSQPSFGPEAGRRGGRAMYGHLNDLRLGAQGNSTALVGLV